MVIEDLNLNAAKRVAQIVQDNLLLVGVSTVGVRAVTGLIGFVLGFAGVVLGFGVGYGILRFWHAAYLVSVFGIGLGVLIFLVCDGCQCDLSYTSIAYHTCLYLWARDVESAQAAGQPIRVAAPAPLAAVLG